MAISDIDEEKENAISDIGLATTGGQTAIEQTKGTAISAIGQATTGWPISAIEQAKGTAISDIRSGYNWRPNCYRTDKRNCNN